MSDIFTIRQVADRFGVKPAVIVNLFYTGVLDNDRCPLHGRSRIIQLDYLPTIEQALRDAGKLPQPAIAK
jgi:hypothetical protein